MRKTISKVFKISNIWCYLLTQEALLNKASCEGFRDYFLFP